MLQDLELEQGRSCRKMKLFSVSYDNELCVLEFKSLVILEGGPTCGRNLREVGITLTVMLASQNSGPRSWVIVSCPGMTYWSTQKSSEKV